MRITTPRWTQGNGATRAVALEVLIHGPLSRSEVARRLDLSPGSLTRLSAPLLDSGLLIEVGEHSDGRVGRPSQLLDVVPASRRFIGMKLMADEIAGVTTDLRGNVLATEGRRLEARDPQSVVATITELATSLRRGRPEITALGIGVGGLVGEHGLVQSAPFLHWNDVPLGSMVEAVSGIPTIVENDLVAGLEPSDEAETGEPAPEDDSAGQATADLEKLFAPAAVTSSRRKDRSDKSTVQGMFPRKPGEPPYGPITQPVPEED